MKTETTRVLRGLLCLAAAPMLMGSECEQPLVKDSGFDLWCGDKLCDWQVDDGTVVKVPTWNAHDYGVGLDDFSAAISQTLPYTSADVSCIHFDLLANVDDNTDVVLMLDFDGGAFQMFQTIVSGTWTPLSYHLELPSYFQSLRVSISKHGVNRAELAHIQASKANDCVGPPPLDPLGRPAGATCEMDSQCAAGRCWARRTEATLAGVPMGSVCSDCYITVGFCAAGQVCGLAWSSAFPAPFQSCITPPVPALALGSRCLDNEECATGSCCEGVCSTCCTYGGAPDCADGTFCERPLNPEGNPLRIAWQCSPQERHGAAGTACLSDDDCASGTCAGSGPLQVCTDGRSCTSNADCPMSLPGNSCTAIGVAGGQCQ